ncbi:hypothetical protein EDD17DRAFT_1470299 [Pisolithus thermaeus]|nr:hypothetical protein EV401DRAFT_1864691 [Pisolithus croceorrhizus]KAI6166756.1 hypothetical protein EDD17DRAFT_1470299 [Pisolithus thermaeus]
MSATIVFGFFTLANGKHVKMLRAGSSTAMYHCVYETMIQCTSGMVFPAMLCVYSPFNNVVLTDNTVAFVLAKITIPANVMGDPILLKGICVVPVPGSVNTEDYKRHIPDFPHPMIIGLGSVTNQPKTLCNGTSKAFNVISTNYVQDSRMALTT